jgi:hypothetical protein
VPDQRIDRSRSDYFKFLGSYYDGNAVQHQLVPCSAAIWTSFRSSSYVLTTSISPSFVGLYIVLGYDWALLASTANSYLEELDSTLQTPLSVYPLFRWFLCYCVLNGLRLAQYFKMFPDASCVRNFSGCCTEIPSETK